VQTRLERERRLQGCERMTEKQGLYDPAYEHDACGIGFVAHIHGVRSRDVVEKSLKLLENLSHRSAVAADACTGDGAGILLQVPHTFLRRVCGQAGISLPDAGLYGVGNLFLPSHRAERVACEQIIEKTITEEGCSVLGWRDVPVDDSVLSGATRRERPIIRQIFVARKFVEREVDTTSSFEVALYLIRRKLEAALRARPGARDCSARTNCRDSTTISATLTWRARSRSSTRDSRPTRFRPGGWLTHTGSSATTARSTRCAGI
jgi:glutamate synthase domain-containing protein 1